MKRSSPSTLVRVSASGRVLPENWLGVIAVIWSGQAASILTSYAASFAAVWYVTESTGSALMLALVGMAAYLPYGLLAPFGGVVADRHSRKVVMLVSELGIGATSLTLGLVVLFGQASVAMIFVVVLLRGVGMAFRGPAMMAAMPMLVPKEHIVRINTLDQLLSGIAGIGAPALGILLYTVVGFYAVLFLDCAGALLAALGLALAKIPATHDAAAAGQRVWANLKSGLLALLANRGLSILIIGVTLGMLVFAPLGAIFPLMTAQHFHGDGYMASMAEGAFAVGMLVGSAILIAWGGGRRLVLVIVGAMLVVGLATAACGLLAPTMFALFIILVAVMSLACTGFNGPLMALIQSNVPEAKLGRAIGLASAAMGLAAPLGIALGGLLAQAIGVAPFFVVDGLA
ncbi:MAG: MFS transporter, partial [Coriobacteriia bacterium]|nr:MFS transporter [Coriobacteriia bacterium]